MERFKGSPLENSCCKGTDLFVLFEFSTDRVRPTYTMEGTLPNVYRFKGYSS